jgi:hypothetical protein
VAEETKSMLAEPLGFPEWIDRRLARRYRVVQRCLVRPISAMHAGPEDWKGLVCDLSSTGLALAMSFAVRPGTVLTIEPWGLDRSLSLEVRVVRALPVEFLWLHGCELARPLSDAVLRVWLQSAVIEQSA